MTYDPDRHHRRSIRLQGYDYAQAGAYFVTVVTHGRVCLFGDVVDGSRMLSEWGKIAQERWDAIPVHFPNVQLDTFVVMPNHVHGIIMITDGPNVGARHAVPLQHAERFGKPVSGSIPTIVRSFKSAVTKRINERRGAPGTSVWQQDYYEHIIRDEDEFSRIREYIINNPLQWAVDRENPSVEARFAHKKEA